LLHLEPGDLLRPGKDEVLIGSGVFSVGRTVQSDGGGAVLGICQRHLYAGTREALVFHHRNRQFAWRDIGRGNSGLAVQTVGFVFHAAGRRWIARVLHDPDKLGSSPGTYPESKTS